LIATAQAAQTAGQLPQAQEAYLAVLEREPAHNEALSGMAQLAERAGDFEAAVHYGSRLVAVRSRDPSAHFALGNFLARRYDFPRARDCYRAALAIDATAAGVWNNLGNVEKYIGNLPESIACYDRAVACDPGNASLESNALIALCYDYSTSHDELIRRHRTWASRHAAPFYPHPRTWPNTRDPERKLRIGYVSQCFDSRVLGHFVRSFLRHHDSAKVEIHGYSGTRHPDEMTKEIREAFAYWTDIRALDDDAVAARIESDAIDILVDLDGHMPDTRLLIFARKPAPVQVTWIGYWNTTGMATVDYIVTDRYTTPHGSPQRFSEQPLYLPHTRFCYAPVGYAPEVATPPSQRRGVFTFGSFNRYDKLGIPLIDAWAEILRRAPGSQLLIKASAIDIPYARDELARRFAARGISPERVELRGRTPHAVMLAEYADVDLGLDTFPYNGGLTTCEALWMGVPIVAIEGERMISRQTSAMLRAVGLPEFIASSWEGYVELALQWSRRRDELAAIRESLRDRMRASPLCDGPRFARDAESAFCRIWHDYCGSPPAQSAGATAIC